MNGICADEVLVEWVHLITIGVGHTRALAPEFQNRQREPVPIGRPQNSSGTSRGCETDSHGLHHESTACTVRRVSSCGAQGYLPAPDPSSGISGPASDYDGAAMPARAVASSAGTARLSARAISSRLVPKLLCSTPPPAHPVTEHCRSVPRAQRGVVPPPVLDAPAERDAELEVARVHLVARPVGALDEARRTRDARTELRLERQVPALVPVATAVPPSTRCAAVPTKCSSPRPFSGEPMTPSLLCTSPGAARPIGCRGNSADGRRKKSSARPSKE